MASLAREGSAVLARAGIPTAALDAEILLAHILGVGRPHLHARPEEPVRPEDARRYAELLTRRAARVPLQYLTGVQEFWSLPFHVTPAVLIPRPETELLVEAFVRLNQRPDPMVIDVGTGSGCLAIAVAHEAPGALVHATDLSEEALGVARLNASDNDVAGRIAFYHGDLLAPLRGLGLEGRADFILSNPPYIAEADLPGLEPEVGRHEPRLSLTPGADPLLIHRRLAREAPPFLKPGGHLLVEIGRGQEEALPGIYGATPAPGAGRLEVIEVRPDLAGIPRLLVARRPPAAS
ncbi:MAG TPA: peptide chain release factor N(5)-glutamine methyltransferase [Candidatus Polarisedimenticolia bacterium]|nr:peptide chain release factor N(5)-glutamine methyltransferase [Candidatus Polarisedimenticolia bacterium]